MATRRALVGVGVAALIAGATGTQLLSSEDAPTARSHIGAGTSSVTLPGTGVVVVHGGDAGTLDAAGAADGAVVAVVNGVPALVTAGGAGPTIGSGTYASRPASPATGDIYTVTSGARRGSVYRASGASTWELWRVLPPVSSATVMLDGERFEGIASGTWVNVWPGEVGASLTPASPGSAAVVLASAAGGLPGVTIGNTQARVGWTGPTGAAAKWLAVVVSRVTTTYGSGYTVLTGWGRSDQAGTLFALSPRFADVDRWTMWTGQSASPASSSTPSAGTTPSLLVIDYDGTTARLYQDGTSLATATPTLNTVSTNPLTLGCSPNNGGDCAGATFHALLAGAGTLDAAARSALRTWSQDRFGSP